MSCPFCNHETNEEAKRFPIDNDAGGSEEAYIDEDNLISVYSKGGEWTGFKALCCPMCGDPMPNAENNFDPGEIPQELLDRHKKRLAEMQNEQ